MDPERDDADEVVPRGPYLLLCTAKCLRFIAVLASFACTGLVLSPDPAITWSH